MKVVQKKKLIQIVEIIAKVFKTVVIMTKTIIIIIEMMALINNNSYDNKEHYSQKNKLDLKGYSQRRKKLNEPA